MSKPSSIVVGAGAGGLVAALYLQKFGHDVLLLEAKSRVGGCASAFPMKNFRFLAGATTLMGLEGEMPLAIVLRELEIPPLEEKPVVATKNITVRHGATSFTLTQNRNDNEAQLRALYGPRFVDFWRASTELGAEAWSLITQIHFPPRGPSDLLGAATNSNAWKLLPALLRGTRSRLGFENKVLDELLLVSTQATSEDTPWLFGALGIEYLQRPLTLLKGGLPSLLEHLADVFVKRGGTLKFDSAVTSFAKTSSGFSTGQHEAENLVLNLTHWDAHRLASDELKSEFAGTVKRHRDAWATCTLYLGVEDVFGDDVAPYHQLVVDEPLRGIGAHSTFATLSPGPAGFRAVTMSTHARSDVNVDKNVVSEVLIDALTTMFPAVKEAQKPVVMPGTPTTWQNFTGRTGGRVGGLPFDFATIRNGFPSGRTGMRGLVRVGDTVFPGQSVPACAWGARRVISELVGSSP
ncbi:MAG: phytoene desaturase family protein [Archangium sp.]